jgi:hypothetical protein
VNTLLSSVARTVLALVVAGVFAPSIIHLLDALLPLALLVAVLALLLRWAWRLTDRW